jgi:hypothetical protein
MRQVPQIPYGVVGDGKVARHFIHYFALLGLPVRQWSRRLAQSITVDQALADCETVLLLIRDSALESFISENPGLARKRLIHFSGSLVVSGAQGFHPLMSFAQDLYDLATYESIPFVYEPKPHGFEEIFPELKNPHYAIDPEHKPLYHALCVMGGNFTVLLWQKLFIEFQSKLGLPWQAAIPYLKQVAKNLAQNPDAALTGPLARKDFSVIEKNMNALSGDPYRGVYEAFVRTRE